MNSVKNNSNSLFGSDIRSLASMSPFAKNPFASQAEASTEVPEDAPEGSYTYALVKSGPEVPAAECETQAAAIEVMILWGNSVLHVAHLSPPRSFYVGEDESGNDFVVPAGQMGAARLPVVLVEQNAASVVLPSNAAGSIEIDGVRSTVRQVLDTPLALPCAELSGAQKLALRIGVKAKIEIGGITFQVAAVNAGRAVKGGRVDTKSLPYHAISFGLHVGVLAAAAFLMPPLANAAEDTITPDQQFLIQHALQVSADKEMDRSKNQEPSGSTQNPGGAAPTNSRSSESAATNPRSSSSNWRSLADRSGGSSDPRMDRAAALRDAEKFGMIELLNPGPGSMPMAQANPWGNLVPVGGDPNGSAISMWSNSLGDPNGTGLDLTSIGEPGGRPGDMFRQGNIKTAGDPSRGPAGILKGNRPSGGGVPVIRPIPPVKIGQLPAEIIQRIVRQNFGRFRFCYEDGLRTNPSLAGRVAVRFVIGRDGSVSQVANGGSDLPDSAVVSCVVRSFYGMSFPAPEEGIVTVTYPIMFSPSK